MRAPTIFCLKEAVFPFKVIFYVGAKPAGPKIQKIAKRFGVKFGKDYEPSELPDAKAVTREWPGAGAVFVWFPDWKTDSPHLDSLAHEMVHVIAALSAKVGEPMGDGPNELQAYYAGWLTGEFIKRMGAR
jgi:hypothetical protein